MAPIPELFQHAEFWLLLALAATLLGLVASGARRRRELRRLLRLYTSIIDASPDSLSLVGPDYRYKVVNDTYLRRTGLARDAVVGKTVAELLGAVPFRELIKPKLDQALAGEVVHYQSWFRFETQGRRFVRVSYAPYYADAEHTGIDGVLVCGHDITDIKRAEQERQTTRRMLSAMLDNSPGIICIKDRDLRVLALNRRGEELFGIAQAEITGARAEQLFPPAVAAAMAARDREVLQSQQATTSEEQLPTPNGERTLLTTRFALPERDGRVNALCSMSIDITEWQAALAAQRREAALRESEERFRTLANGLPSLNWLTDADCRVELVNQRFIAYFGRNREQLSDGRWRALVHPDDLQRIEAQVTRAIKTRKELRAECRLRRKDGVWRWVDCAASPRCDSEGRFAGFVGAARDIHRRKQTAEALHQSRQALKERSIQLGLLAKELTRAEQQERRRLGQLLHDHLQQLLVGALIAAERVQRHPTPEAADDLERLGMLLNEAITASRTLMADLSPPILHEDGLTSALQWLARLMQRRHRLAVELDLAEDLSPDDEILRVFLFECVREALFNVVKHAGVLAAKVELRRQGSDNLRIWVSDRGRGFDASALSERRPSPEDGLGLVSMRERMSLLGGEAHVESHPGGGTRVMLSAPLSEPQDADGQPDDDAPLALPDPTPRPPASTDADRAPVTLLLVDDHVVMRNGLSSLLQDEEDWLQVVGEASNGLEAIAKSEQLQPDIVLMDYSMPQMDGIEATRLIHKRWPWINIIGLSLYEDADRAAAMIEAGACDYVCKSSITDELLDKLILHAPEGKERPVHAA